MNIFLLLIPILFLFLLRRRVIRKDEIRLPPGPWQLPIIGSLHHLLMKPQPVHRVMANLAHKCNAPIMHLRLGELQVVVISSADAAKEVLKTHDVTFATRAMSLTVKATIGDRLGLFFLPYGAKWRELRKICTIELLSTHRVRSFRPIREDEAARLVSSIVSLLPGGQVNLSECVARLVTDSALRAIMGEHFQWREEFLETIAMTYKKAKGFRIGDLFPSSSILRALSGTVREAKQYNAKLFELVDRAIVQHEERKMGAVVVDNSRKTLDLLDVLLSIMEEDNPGCSLTIASIKAVILDIFVAGSTGTSAVIQWTMLELMRNPGVLQKVQFEIRHVLQGKPKVTEDDLSALKYLKLVIKETLRLHPAPPLPLPKECQESCKILGYDVPRGAIVFVNSWAIGRDPIYWNEPDVFMPERFDGSTVDFKATDFGFIPFGAGRRVCPGIMFAHAHIELVLATLLSLRLAPPTWYHAGLGGPDRGNKFGCKPKDYSLSTSGPSCIARRGTIDISLFN